MNMEKVMSGAQNFNFGSASSKRRNRFYIIGDLTPITEKLFHAKTLFARDIKCVSCEG